MMMMLLKTVDLKVSRVIDKQRDGEKFNDIQVAASRTAFVPDVSRESLNAYAKQKPINNPRLACIFIRL